MASAAAASSLTTLDFLRHLCEGGRRRRPSSNGVGSSSRRRGRNSCGDADCGGLHLVSACVRLDHVDHLHKNIDQKVQVVGVKLKVGSLSNSNLQCTVGSGKRRLQSSYSCF